MQGFTNNARFFLSVIGAFLTTMAPTLAQTTWYADANAPGPADGRSWSTAFADLQDALAAAHSGDRIYVAGGTYKPDRGTGDRTASFALGTPLEVYGGYGGCGAADPNHRDLVAHPTILTGDLRGDDLNGANTGDNSQTVIKASNITSLRLDGLSVTGGNAPVETGGVQLLQVANVVVQDCVIRANRGYRSGGLRIEDAQQLTVRRCIVERNSVAVGGWGGGLLVSRCNGEIVDSTIADNSGTAVSLWYRGSVSGATCSIRDSTITNNEAGLNLYDGSFTVADCHILGNRSCGITMGSCSATIADCVIRHNSYDSHFAGGGVTVDDYAIATLRRCTISGNSSAASGGGLLCAGGTATLRNCVVAGNFASNNGGGVAIVPDYMKCTVTLIGSTVTGNTCMGTGDGCYVNSFYTYYPGNLAINSSVVWGNGNTDIGAFYATPTVTYSLVGTPISGTGNVVGSPHFVDAVQGDYRLSPWSSCIEAGDPAYIAEPGETDAAGNARIVGGHVDMGAYECNTAPQRDDTDEDGMADAWELLYWADLSHGATEDADGDGLTNLYEYEHDSNPVEGAHTPTAVPGGPVSGKWDWGHSPYLVQGPITVASGQTLEIGPGVEVRFGTTAGLSVPYGTTLMVKGVQDGLNRAPVLLTADASVTPGAWDGLYVSGYAMIKSATIEYAHTGMTCDESSPLLEDCIIQKCASHGLSASAMPYCDSSASSHPILRRCRITDNGGSGINLTGSGNGACGNGHGGHANADVINCMLVGNGHHGIRCAAWHGFWSYGSSSPVIVGSIVAANGECGVEVDGDDEVAPVVVNNTIVGNEDAGINIVATGTSATVQVGNNVVSQNHVGIRLASTLTADHVPLDSNDVWGNAVAEYTGNIADPTGSRGNISQDPAFRNPLGPDNDRATWQDNDYRLARGSPCIDAGSNAALPSAASVDLDGNPRRLDDPKTADTGSGAQPIVDMGAYEFAPVAGADFDYDTDVDLTDFLHFQACFNGPNRPAAVAGCDDADLDHDLDVDLADFLIFQACFNGPNRPPVCR